MLRLCELEGYLQGIPKSKYNISMSLQSVFLTGFPSQNAEKISQKGWLLISIMLGLVQDIQ
jgi:hypothetical protein